MTRGRWPAATANAERAGVVDDIEFATRVVSHLPARPGPGLVATNPPYGKRVGGARLDGLYRRFGIVLRERLPAWDLAIVSPDPKLAARTDRGLRPLIRFGHGGIPVQVLYRPARPPRPEPVDEPAPAGEEPAPVGEETAGHGQWFPLGGAARLIPIGGP